ncbi:MAG: polysaccharide biosynthesis/export family protein [Prevotella sp.]
MKKLISPFIIVLILAALFDSCSSSKNVTYFQNVDNVDLTASRGLYDAKIMPKDMLSITVNTIDPNVSKLFNLYTGSASGATNSMGQGYLVDNNGNINFPIVGSIHVAGLTKGQCEDLIRDKIMPNMSATENPVVTVRMASFRVTVLGEVASPSVIPVTSEKMSVLEALAQAGDLTIYGKRDNVLLIREDQSGQKVMHRLNLKDAELINSPYYYLQQNDVLYVEPNKAKASTSSVSTITTFWVSTVSALASLTSLIVNLVR